MQKIYLAAPYTHPDKSVMEQRVKLINAKAASMMRYCIVFSPISHSHYIAVQNDLPLTFEFWVIQNHAFIDWCDIVVVYQLKGWEESYGIQDEISYATTQGKLIVYEPEGI